MMFLSCPHFSISIRQRSKRQSAVAGAAYQSGEKLFSEYDGKTKNYRYKAPEVVCSEIILPFHAPPEYKDRQTLWNAAERVEKQWNSQLSRGIIIALPREIPKEQYAGLVRDYCVEQFVSKGMCVDFAVHDKGDGNPHAHIMLTMRSMNEQGRWNPKAHKVYDLDENGERIVLSSGEYKSHKENVVDWNNQSNAEIWRTVWAAAVNRCYERNNSPVRIDLRSFERQGVDQVPTVHLGPAVCHMEDKGIQTEIGNYNREIKLHNTSVKSLKSLIVSLEAWFVSVKEKLSLLFAKEEKSPSLASILNTYGSIRKQGRADWSNSGKQKGAVLDLKFNAKAVTTMNALGIYTLDDFGNLIDELKPYLNQIAANEKQIRKLTHTIEHIGNFQKYKSIYDQSKKGFDKTKAKYAETHKTELVLFGKSVRYLKANKLNVSEVDAYHEQRDALKAENAEIHAKLLSLRLDTELIRQIQHCVDTVKMNMLYTQEQINRANQINLAAFLQSQGETLERAGVEYRWKRHNSLTIRGNKWYRHSRSRGGGPIDFVMEFYGKSFTEAVAMLLNETPPTPQKTASEFRLPTRGADNNIVRKYLTQVRRIDEDVTDFFISSGDVYEDAIHHNAVFVGRDENGIPRYAHSKGTTGSFRADVTGSDKSIPFQYCGEGDRLFVFEAPIDLLSFLCLFKKDWQKHSYLSLGGVCEKALLSVLSDRPNIKTVYLCLDSDEAGNTACTRINMLIPEGYEVNRLVPLFKDWNEVLRRRSEIPDSKFLGRPVYSLREQIVEIIRMSDVELQNVEWLWNPYIPFGKVTIIQGNPGEGKTTLALRLCAACTNRKPFPGMPELEPFNVIYQTAEDGLGDTVKPRLMEAEADLNRVLVIDEAKQGLSLSDERIEKAIRQTSARLIVLDPLQAYLGAETDMNRANEIRPIIKGLADAAERTGCAVILLGHLNKASGTQAAYRGLGSIDFRAAARSVLLIGRVKKEPNIRVIIHDKSSLAPEGKPMAFSLGNEDGFKWIGEYDITADELLSGKEGNSENKIAQAESLILALLEDGKEMFNEDIQKAADEAGISERTMRTAKSNLSGRIKRRRVGTQWMCCLVSALDPEPASETANGKGPCRLPDGFCRMEMEPNYSDAKQQIEKAAETMERNSVDITGQCEQDDQKE